MPCCRACVSPHAVVKEERSDGGDALRKNDAAVRFDQGRLRQVPQADWVSQSQIRLTQSKLSKQHAGGNDGWGPGGPGVFDAGGKDGVGSGVTFPMCA